MTHHDIQAEKTGPVPELLLDDAALAARITKLKVERNAVILAHNYQRPEVQDVADITGDSLGLSREAARTGADVIVFCGVHFMAETAFMLSPAKTVLLPEMEAGCPMADMVDSTEVARLKAEHPRAVVVSYVNTTAAVKAESDYCCTSANAPEVVAAVDSDEVLFLPDRNLGAWVAGQVDKRVILMDGYCPTHDRITAEHVLRSRELHPRAEVIAHPECRGEVLELADHVRSTSGMLDAARDSGAGEFIVATESGMIHPLSKAAPDKKFYPPEPEPVCPNMKLITLSKVLWSLETMAPVVRVPEDIRLRGLEAVERMLALG